MPLPKFACSSLFRTRAAVDRAGKCFASLGFHSPYLTWNHHLHFLSRAHACAEQIESDGMRMFNNPASKTLSVQQLVSCDHGKGQLGCGGGLQETGFDYVRTNGGIVSAADYPYTAKTGKCDASKNHYIMGVTGYKMILEKTPADTEKAFANYMLSTGTISIGADATTWNTYKSGIMSNCGKGTDVNHAVQLTGVDTSAGYWKVISEMQKVHILV